MIKESNDNGVRFRFAGSALNRGLPLSDWEPPGGWRSVEQLRWVPEWVEIPPPPKLVGLSAPDVRRVVGCAWKASLDRVSRTNPRVRIRSGFARPKGEALDRFQDALTEVNIPPHAWLCWGLAHHRVGREKRIPWLQNLLGWKLVLDLGDQVTRVYGSQPHHAERRLPPSGRILACKVKALRARIRSHRPETQRDLATIVAGFPVEEFRSLQRRAAIEVAQIASQTSDAIQRGQWVWSWG